MEAANFEDIDHNEPEPRIYEIVMEDGKQHLLSGFLGMNDAFVAVADDNNRLIFASPLNRVVHAKALAELPVTKSVN